MLMTRFLAIIGLLTLVAICLFCSQYSRRDGAELELKYRYLVVSIEAPPAWVKGHKFSIQWQGKTVPLPVAFRVPGFVVEDFHLGAAPEEEKYLVIGRAQIPVTGEPETQFRVSNEGGVDYIPEPASRKGAVALSVASWVVICPPNQPGQVNPRFPPGEFEAASRKLESRLKALVAAGQVIDVQPDR
jgi:hypothetical protein